MSTSGSDDIKLIANNRRARFEYTLSDRYEAGLQLVGSEVKSLRDGQVNFRDAYAAFSGHELFLHGLHIAEYAFANQFNHEPLRTRKLLLWRHELRQIRRHLVEQGYTLVPTRMYFKRGRAKVELALAKGKKLYDKRHAIKTRDMKRDLERERD